MIEIIIPGRNNLILKNVVLDFNGTMAEDGILIAGVEEMLNCISKVISVYVITADTFGTAQQACSYIDCKVTVLTDLPIGDAKVKFIRSIGADQTIAIGNGNNDCAMLSESAVGIVVSGREGASCRAIQSGDIFCFNIIDALDLILNTRRIVATLRP